MRCTRYTNSSVIIAYDCQQAHSFFERTFQKDVVYVKNIEYVIKNGRYLKVIFMNNDELTNQLVRFSASRNNLFSFNTGVTSFGDCDYHRFEIMASDKYTAIQYLMGTMEVKGIDVISLGDETSDFGLAKFALTMNLFDNNKGFFAFIGSGTAGHILLEKESGELAAALGCKNRCKVYPNVMEDGWKIAVEEWLNA